MLAGWAVAAFLCLGSVLALMQSGEGRLSVRRQDGFGWGWSSEAARARWPYGCMWLWMRMSDGVGCNPFVLTIHLLGYKPPTLVHSLGWPKAQNKNRHSPGTAGSIKKRERVAEAQLDAAGPQPSCVPRGTGRCTRMQRPEGLTVRANQGRHATKPGILSGCSGPAHMSHVGTNSS